MVNSPSAVEQRKAKQWQGATVGTKDTGRGVGGQDSFMGHRMLSRQA